MERAKLDNNLPISKKTFWSSVSDPQFLDSSDSELSIQWKVRFLENVSRFYLSEIF